jgi:hypothetical protein
MIRYLPLMGLLFILELSFAADNLPKGKLVSPYEGCKEALLVDSEAYKKNQRAWDELADECGQKVLSTENVSITDIMSPLKEGAYLGFAQQVALEVKKNLNRHKAFHACTVQCFEGAKTCGEVNCDERKKSIVEKLKIDSRRARIELALSRSASDLYSVTPRSILTLSDEQRINHNLMTFEIGPNPVGENRLTDREMKEAKRRLLLDKERVEKAAKKKNLSQDYDWISFQQFKKMEDHQNRYKDIIYLENPLLATLDKPQKLHDGEAEWSAKQIVEAAKKLQQNAQDTLTIVDLSLKENKLEYSRWKGEAMGQWLYSQLPGTTDRHDLLFYFGMKNVVEAVLKRDPSLCGLATSLHHRLTTKEVQNTTLSTGASVAPLGLKYGAKLVGSTSEMIGAIVGLQSNAYLGLAMGSTYPLDSFSKFKNTMKEASVGLRSIDEIKKARSNAKLGAAVAVLNVGNAVTVGKTVFQKLAFLGRHRASGQENAQAWLMERITDAVDAKMITAKEAMTLKEKASRHLMDTLFHDIEKLHPEYFKNPDNMNFFLKASAIVTKFQKGDPVDLSVKVKNLVLTVNQEAVKNSWNPKAQKGLLTVLDNSMIELREAFKKDPVTYSKFTTDVSAKEKIFRKALKRSGVKDDRVNALAECVFPGKKR